MAGIFYRNVRSGDQLETFLIAAISSLLLVRFYLHLTGYPQIGHGGLHVAHVLFGGLFMTVGLVIAFSFLGTRALRVAAIVGGVGFGVFIDEVGKFITRDNNYFYQPAVGIIYAVFIVLYLIVNFLSRHRTLTPREYLLNALSQLEEAAEHDMDSLEYRRTENLLAKADQTDPVTIQLKALLERVPRVADGRPGPLRRLFLRAHRLYAEAVVRRSSRRLIRGFFVLEPSSFWRQSFCQYCKTSTMRSMP